MLFEIGSNKTDCYVTDIKWNPTVPTMLCTVTSDYTIGIFQLKGEEELRDKSVPKIPIQSKLSSDLQVLCAAWSPKGKQVVVGCKNGNIIQLKPDLKIARTILGPSPSIGEVISILWISNYQFCTAYLNSERHVNVLIVDAPKGEANATFTCYEDITYGFLDAEGEGSVLRYYFEHVPEWGLIMAGSSNSSEIAVLGTTDGGANWNQWQLVDSGRAQLPLMRTTEIFPVGLAVDKSPTNKLPWGTDSTLPHPVPILHILGTSGKLCSFHMVNLAPNCLAINSPPTEIMAAPLAPPQLPNILSEDISFNMNAAVTSSTPRPKQPDIVSERSKAAPIANIFGDSLRAAGFFQQPHEQPKQQEEKTVMAPVVAISPKPVIPKETPALAEPAKTEFKLAADKEVSLQMAEQKAFIDDSIRMRAYVQEQALFDRELRSRLEPQAWECGTDEEKRRLGEACAVIEQFLRDLKDTTNSLSNDIAYLKALLLQSFAWLEETKSKNAASTDITTRNCRENSKIADLQRWYYYTQTQLNQVSKILDLEWSEHKAQEMSKMKIPSLEFVYQNLLLHNKIIAKEKEKLEQISQKWKSLNRASVYATGVMSTLNRSMSNLHVSSPKLSASAIRGNADVIDARCKTIASKTLSFTYEKQIRLKALLTESTPRVIKPVNPSPIQDRLKNTLSSLASFNPTASIETKTKLESPIVSKPSSQINKTQAVEKTKSQNNPLASLNSIVARIGTSDTNGVMQNKVQQKPLSTTASFTTTISAKQMEKKPTTIPAIPTASQPKSKQDLNINFPSITFGTSTPKSQDVLFPKAPPVDATVRNNKESTTNDIAPKAPDSALFSTGLLKDVLSTEYSLTKTEGIVRNLPSLATTPIAKTDVAATFSFATPSVVPLVAKNSPSANPLDTMMSFAYPKTAHTLPAVEPSVSVVQAPMQAPMQTPIDLTALSLGSSGSLTLQAMDHPNNSTDGKTNAIVSAATSFSASACAITQTLATAAIAPSVTTIGGITISLVNTSVARKHETSPVSSSVTIKEVTTSEVKAPINFGATTTSAPSTSLLAASIFGGQNIIKNAAMVAEAPTTLPASTAFSAVAFPSITPTFGGLTSTSSAPVPSGFSNMSTGATTSPAVTAVSNSAVSPFQNSLTKPMFGEATVTSMPATSFGVTASNTSAGTIAFGIPTTTTVTVTVAAATAATAATSIAPAFGKSPIESPASNAQFPSIQTPASTTNVFGKPVISPASTPFGNTSSSVFSNMPAASSNTSIFGGSGGMNSIFGSTPLSTTSGSIFGGNSTGFGTASPGSIFDTSTPKPANIFGGATNTPPASPFGSVTNNASPTSVAGTNVFKSTVTNTSSMGAQQSPLGNQPVFGQAPAFGAKPVFGSPPPVFGTSKPVFGSGFGSPPTFDSPGIGKIVQIL